MIGIGTVTQLNDVKLFIVFTLFNFLDCYVTYMCYLTFYNGSDLSPLFNTLHDVFGNSVMFLFSTFACCEVIYLAWLLYMNMMRLGKYRGIQYAFKLVPVIAKAYATFHNTTLLLMYVT